MAHEAEYRDNDEYAAVCRNDAWYIVQYDVYSYQQVEVTVTDKNVIFVDYTSTCTGPLMLQEQLGLPLTVEAAEDLLEELKTAVATVRGRLEAEAAA